MVEGETKWQALVQNSLDIITVIQTDGTVKDVSPSVEHILGYKPEELIGENAFKLIHPDDVAKVEHNFFKKIIENPTLNPFMEYRCQRKDGSWCFLELIGKSLLDNSTVAGIVAYSRDITERKQQEIGERQQVEEELRQQSQRARLLAVMCDRIRQSLNLGEILNTTVAEVRQFLACDRVIIFRFQPDWSGVVIVESATPGWAPILATTIIDPCFREVYVSRYQQGHISAVDDIYTSGFSECHINLLAELQVRANLIVPILQDKNQLWGLLIAHNCAAPRHWQQFEIDLLSSLATQVAIAIQQAQLYQKISAINTDLERQVQERTIQLEQKIEELQELNILKDDFLSTVSHELRTPLANMKMAIQMLKISSSKDKSQRYLEILQAQCDRETELINDLLDLQRLEADSYPQLLTEVLNLAEWLPTIFEPFHSRIQERQQSLQVDIPPNLPPLVSERTGLERILAELLNNACKYTPAGGEIIFAVCHRPTSLQPEADTDAVTTFTMSNQAEIPQAALSHVFDKFYRVPNADPWKQGGTGLGLALVKKLVHHLGGIIQVESSDGWTKFTVTLSAHAL